jgi:K+ transporter
LANANKFVHGGWFLDMMAAIISAIMLANVSWAKVRNGLLRLST